jgi:hypothetical protein
MSHYIKLTTLRNNYIKNLREAQDGKTTEDKIAEKQMELDREFKEEVLKLREKEQEED